jgi:hypothetical protein
VLSICRTHEDAAPSVQRKIPDCHDPAIVALYIFSVR